MEPIIFRITFGSSTSLNQPCREQGCQGHHQQTGTYCHKVAMKVAKISHATFDFELEVNGWHAQRGAAWKWVIGFIFKIGQLQLRE